MPDGSQELNKHIDKIRGKTDDENLIETCLDNTIKDACSAPQCIWSGKKCKIVISSSLYKTYMKQLTEEITKNELQRFDILGNNLDLVIDRSKFVKRPTELIFETVPRIIFEHQLIKK